MEKTKDIIDVANKEDNQKKLILFNDDGIAFDFIVICLTEVCKFDYLQANNCALIAHYKGKCCIKNGTFKELEPIHTAMANRQITTEIQ